jgi:hypothetical protein
LSVSPQPQWARVHVEVHEQPGWLDDCFRSTLWTKFQSAASEGFENTNDISGDYATMSVTEGGTTNGCGWKKDISAAALSTSTYPSLRVRLRGRGTMPQYRIAVEATDATVDDTGWTDAPTEFEAVTLHLTAAKTVKYVRLYARSSTAGASAQIDYDYAVLQRSPPLIPAEHYETEVDLRHTSASSGFRVRCWHDPLHGVTARRYRFEEGASVKAYDLSDDAGHGSLVGSPTWSTGKHGGCLQFTGASSQRIDTGYTKAIAATGALTIALWVKGNSGATGVIVGSGKAVTGGWNRLQLNLQSTDKVRIYAKDDALNLLQYTSTTAVLDGAWHHVAAVVDPANDRVQLYVDGEYDGQTTGTLGAITLTGYDFTLACLHNESGYTSYATVDLDEAAVYEKALTAAEVTALYRRDPYSGVSRAAVGAWAMIYVAAEPESLVYKLIAGRVIDRSTGDEGGAPWVELCGEDAGEIMHDRSWSRNFASATQISAVASYVIDDSVDELYKDIDLTSRAITNSFENENCWGVLQKLAEAAYFATGEGGAHFFVDPGGCFRFRKYGSFTCPHALSDGGNGGSPNIASLTMQETLKATPRLANDVEVIIFEGETTPRDGDGWTESADGWSSPDPTDSGYPQSDTDNVAGTASVKFQTTNPGDTYRMRLAVSEVDISGYDSIKFSLKYGSALNIDSFQVRLQKGDWSWTSDYWAKIGVSPPGSAEWNEVTIDLDDFSATGNPGYTIDHIEIKALHGTEIGAGGFLVDVLRFIRNEKSGTASDTASQTSYGRREYTLVDKGITSTTAAGYTASGILANRKNPVVTAKVTTPGRAQPGYRPPQRVTVTSLRDGLNEAQFQIVAAHHRITTRGGYTVNLDLAAARTSSGLSDATPPATPDLESMLTEWRRRLQGEQVNTLRSTWK